MLAMLTTAPAVGFAAAERPIARIDPGSFEASIRGRIRECPEISRKIP
jgi:hypothetical protein